MNNNFRKIFFSNLLVVLIVISNLVGVKFTNFNGLILSVNFVVFPFVYLCFLLINNYTNKKEAILSVLSGVFIQIFILLTYLLVTKLGSQNLIPDFASYINVVFRIDEVYIITNLISLMISCFVLHYIYEYFRIIGYKLLGCVLSLLTSTILYGLISIPVINYGFGIEIILDIIMGHIIMSVIMTVLITILFYLLKDKEYPYNENKLFIKDINLETPKNKKDKAIDEVIKISENKKKKDTIKKNKTKKNDSKVTKKKDTNSKKDVKK